MPLLSKCSEWYSRTHSMGLIEERKQGLGTWGNAVLLRVSSRTSHAAIASYLAPVMVNAVGVLVLHTGGFTAATTGGCCRADTLYPTTVEPTPVVTFTFPLAAVVTHSSWVWGWAQHNNTTQGALSRVE